MKLMQACALALGGTGFTFFCHYSGGRHGFPVPFRPRPPFAGSFPRICLRRYAGSFRLVASFTGDGTGGSSRTSGLAADRRRLSAGRAFLPRSGSRRCRT